MNTKHIPIEIAASQVWTGAETISTEAATFKPPPNGHWFRGRQDALVTRRDGKTTLYMGVAAWRPEPPLVPPDEMLISTRLPIGPGAHETEQPQGRHPVVLDAPLPAGSAG